MTRLAIRLRLIATLAVLLAVAGVAPATGYAEESGATPAVEETQAPPVVEEAPPPAVEEPAPVEPVVVPSAEPEPSTDAPSPQPEPSVPPVETPTTPTEPSEQPTPTDTATPAEPSAPTEEAPASTEEDGEADAPQSRTESPRRGLTVAEEADDEFVTVAVVAFNCAVAPADTAPGIVPAGCTPADGLKFEATVGAVSLGTFETGSDGAAEVTATAGETLTINEDLSTVTDGFAASSPSSSVDVATGAALSLVHVATDDDPVPGVDVGRLQLSQGECPTAGESRTELRYIAPQSLQAQADDGSGCHGVAGAEFLVVAETDGVSAAAVEGVKRTDGNGNWRGELPVGEYVVTDVSSGQSATVAVALNDISVLVAIDYVQQVGGTLSVRRFVCAGEEESVTVTVSASEPAPGSSCGAEDGTFQLNDGEPFTGGGDGAVTFNLPTGTYQFQNITGGGGTQIQIAEGATTWVLIERLTPVGDISVVYNLCVDPADASGDPGDASYWAAACNNPVAGAQLGLVTAAGETVQVAVTDAAGFATWSGIRNGSYRIVDWSADSTCAVFIGQQAALAGFQTAPGRVVSGQVFGCLKGAGNSGGETPGGGNGAPGGGAGGTVDPSAQAPGSAPNLVPNQTVTQLPSTGVSGAAPTGAPMNGLAFGMAAVLMVLAGGFAFGLRRQVR